MPCLFEEKVIWAASWQNQQCGCAPSKDSDQPGHPPSLIRVFAVRMNHAWVLSYPLSAQPRLWSDWADAQADLSLHWAHSHFVDFVTRWLICLKDWYYLQHCEKQAQLNLPVKQAGPCHQDGPCHCNVWICFQLMSKITMWKYVPIEFLFKSILLR